jgi:hypothetical protein
MEVLDLHPAVFAVSRTCDKQIVYALTNVSSKEVSLSLEATGFGSTMLDLITGNQFETGSLRLAPYQFVWLTPFGGNT